MGMHSVIVLFCLLVVVPILLFYLWLFLHGMCDQIFKKKNYACDLLVFADISLWKWAEMQTEPEADC
jgi:hypothetical protein